MIEIFNCEQRSDAWYAARLGIPTASEFSSVLAAGRKKGEESKTRRTYMLKLAGEQITRKPMQGYNNANMERGAEMEPEARGLYELQTSAVLTQVGFIRNNKYRTGCSPDSLVGSGGMLEIKTAFPHILGDLILRGEFPPEHKAQVQGQLWIAEKEWCDLLVFWPDMPTFNVRAHRDEHYINELTSEIERFNAELDSVVAKLRSYGQPLEQAA